MAILIGSVLAAFIDIRVWIVSIPIVALFPSIWIGVLLVGTISAAWIFNSRLEMATILEIPEPGMPEFAFDLFRASVVASVVGILRFFIAKSRGAK
ncbi:MAG: hypothetical protein WAO78_00525 [Roseovarius sp.]